jgi:RNA polymerase sigma factor (sigma-70 family)
VGNAAPSPRPDPRERVIEENLELVRSVARRYADRGEPFDELVQAGSVGLIKAVDRFDPERGTSLATFASSLIEGEIRHHLRRHRRHAAAPVAAAPEPAGDASETERTEARLLLRSGWKNLSERERRLLELRYFGDRTQTQIATELGLSQAQVSRLLSATLARLRQELADDVAAPTDPAYSGPEMVQQASEPEQPAEHSGRLLVRMPPSLHTQLARAAEREGVSLNTLVTGALAGAVGWRDANAEAPPPGPDTPATSPEPNERRRTLLSVALAANFAIVAVAAVLAIVLLVVAWQST